ncbi:pyrroloquinoline quinone biosynthesis protein PqqB [Roseibium aestuarii]|uniref:Coenzyme PQQ synthesis protein B n=1 Tax=Roseibium aestuarii TaxID=2600299 RepID=A0ABW4JUW7_9HYPH|nr:pyrroloquinoline quinone biosynthesis protein PqqB [Roseibium aestuarii]
MKVRILGSAAGGGFPQWNCNAPLSRSVREGRPGFRARTQSSIAASADGRDWVLFNASPDIRQQIAATPELHPRADGPLRHSPIRAVVLTNADVDHIAGLLSLRESEPFALYASERVLATLRDNSIFGVLRADVVDRRPLPLEGRLELAGPDGAPLGLSVETFPVPGKVALFLENEAAADFGTAPGDTMGLSLTNGTGDENPLVYVPGCASVPPTLRKRLEEAACLLFDGTVFHDTEMADSGVGTKTGARMGHMAIAGEQGSLEALSGIGAARKIYVHINTTNPILDPGSEAAARVREAGWEIGFDGMEISL